MRKWEHLKMIACRYMGGDSSLSFWYLPVGLFKNKKLSEKLAGYAIDFRSKTKYANLDLQGIPLINYKGNIGLQYNCCAISQYALGWHQIWIENSNEESRKRFLAQADWLVRNQIDLTSGSKGVWPLLFDLVAYKLKSPWISSLIQSQAISVLLRAYHMTGNCSYLETADRAFDVFLKPVSRGGVTVFTREGVFFEEAPSERPSCILDGFLYSLLSVHEYAIFRQSIQAIQLRDSALKWLEKNISRFDLKFWSRADLYQKVPPCPASRFYHQVHIWLIEALFERVDKNFLSYYARRWKNFDENRYYRLLSAMLKVLFKIFYY